MTEVPVVGSLVVRMLSVENFTVVPCVYDVCIFSPFFLESNSVQHTETLCINLIFVCFVVPTPILSFVC